MTPQISIILRSRNDAAYVRATLASIERQSIQGFELLGVDNDSTDGTASHVRIASDRFLNVPAGRYNPGPVLNRAIRAARGRILVFINCDATPQGHDWLADLVRPLRDSRAVATFGRQMPRPDATPLVEFDYARAFGDGTEHARWHHFFSLANAAVLREVWARHPFDERLRYSEDVEWSYWCRQNGLPIHYVPAARAMHSHNYTVRESWRRHFGEGEADAAIFGYSPARDGFARRLVGRWAASLARDAKHLSSRRMLNWLPKSLAVRTTERLAEFVGFRKGLRNERALHATG